MTERQSGKHSPERDVLGRGRALMCCHLLVLRPATQIVLRRLGVCSRDAGGRWTVLVLALGLPVLRPAGLEVPCTMNSMPFRPMLLKTHSISHFQVLGHQQWDRL